MSETVASNQRACSELTLSCGFETRHSGELHGYDQEILRAVQPRGHLGGEAAKFIITLM